MASRKALAKEMLSWVGADSLQLVDPASGWPAHFRAKTFSDWISVAAYLGPIGHSQRGRGDVERRFQNPGKNRPIRVTPEGVSVLIGLYENDGTRLLVGMDVVRRIGRSTRQSLFMPMHLLRSGGAWGWAHHLSDSGEKLVAFRPELLPIYIELQRSRIDAPFGEIEKLIVAAGANDDESGPEAIKRAIKAAKRLFGATYLLAR